MKKEILMGGLFLGLLSFGLALGAGDETLWVPQVGTAAPNFTLKDQNGKNVSLSQYKGKEFVILYFYPKDETPGCVKEACTFRDDLSWYQKNGVEVLGISVDNLSTHQEFAKHYALNFRILSDANKKVTTRYGVLGDLGMAKRTTFVIDKQGIVRAIFPNVKVDGHSAELQKTITDLAGKG